MIPIEQDDERARRLAEVWQKSAPTAEEIQRVRARLAVRPSRPRRARGKVLVVALIQGFMLGGATLAAAAWVAGRTLPLFEHREPAVATSEAALPPAPARGHAAPAPAKAEESAPASDVPRAAFEGVHGRNAAETARTAHSEETSQRRAPAAVRSAAPEPKPLSGVGLPPLPSDAPVAGEAPGAATKPVDGPWARVARALSASDWTRADRALLELCSSPDPATRDAATLARAELFIAHGQGSGFRPAVERLATSGFTPLVRRRAARLLERLP